MIVDTSAVLAIFFGEDDAALYSDALSAPSPKYMFAATYLEAANILDNRVPESSLDLDDFLRESGIELVPVSVVQSRDARRAYRHYGKGRHPARLNFGDCFAYALAKATGEPLLFKGEDFSETDIASALD